MASHPRLSSFSPGRRLDTDDDGGVGSSRILASPRREDVLTLASNNNDDDDDEKQQHNSPRRRKRDSSPGLQASPSSPLSGSLRKQSSVGLLKKPPPSPSTGGLRNLPPPELYSPMAAEEEEKEEERAPLITNNQPQSTMSNTPTSSKKKKKKKVSSSSSNNSPKRSPKRSSATTTTTTKSKSKSPKKSNKKHKKKEGGETEVSGESGDNSSRILPANLPLVSSDEASNINGSSDHHITKPSSKKKKKKKKEKSIHDDNQNVDNNTGDGSDEPPPRMWSDLNPSSPHKTANNNNEGTTSKSPKKKKKKKTPSHNDDVAGSSESNRNVGVDDDEIRKESAATTNNAVAPTKGKKKKKKKKATHDDSFSSGVDHNPSESQSSLHNKEGESFNNKSNEKTGTNSPARSKKKKSISTEKTTKPSSKKKKKKKKPVNESGGGDHDDGARQQHNDSATSSSTTPDSPRIHQPFHPSNVYVVPEDYDTQHQQQQQQQQPQQIMPRRATSVSTRTSQLPENMLLNHYCSLAHPPADISNEQSIIDADLSWEPVRLYLQQHTTDEIRIAATTQGDQGVTPLHYACRNQPPEDIVHVLISIGGPVITKIQDAFGWLPIHYASANSVSLGVLKLLIEAYPESKSITDRRGRTPLHFAIGKSNPNYQVSPEFIALLSSGSSSSNDATNNNRNATELADESGMLPLHYACAYGQSEECIRVLTDRYPDAISTQDKMGRFPLHFVLSNAGNSTSPAAVRLLLSLRPQIVDAGTMPAAGNGDADGGSEKGPLPLRYLADYAASTLAQPDKGTDIERESVQRCLELLLSCNPNPTADFFTALQSLPTWLRERAVVVPTVQVLLNEKIAEPYPTGVLLSDIFVQFIVLLCYSLVVPQAVARRYSDETDLNYERGLEPWKVVPLYFGALFVLFRAFLRLLSFLSLGAFRIWLYNPVTWLDILYVFVLVYWSTRMISDRETESFRTGSAVSVSVLYVKLLAYLRNTYVDFAVFLVGVLYVARRLVAFLVCLCIILIAFMQMWYTVYLQTDRCKNQPNENKTETELISDIQNEENEIEVYCDRWSAFLNVYTMLLGEVDDTQFLDNGFATALFIVFMFLVVILLANVLIAVVSDSFRVIQEQRAAVVFWRNRLLFIAEMQAIQSEGWRNKVRKAFGFPLRVEESRGKERFSGFRSQWDRLVSFFDDDAYDQFSWYEYVCSMIVRLVIAVFIIPMWFLVGLFSFGILWPPQIREAFFTSTVLKRSSDAEIENEMRNEQVKILKEEVGSLKDGLKEELAMNRTHVFQMKSRLAERKLELQAESKNIKRIVAMLFEQRTSGDTYTQYPSVLN